MSLARVAPCKGCSLQGLLLARAAPCKGCKSRQDRRQDCGPCNLWDVSFFLVFDHSSGVQPAAQKQLFRIFCVTPGACVSQFGKVGPGAVRSPTEQETHVLQPRTTGRSRK
eukprot:gene8447-biopygen1598